MPALYDTKPDFYIDEENKHGGRLYNLDSHLLSFFRNVCVVEPRILSIWLEDNDLIRITSQIDSRKHRLKSSSDPIVHIIYRTNAFKTTFAVTAEVYLFRFNKDYKLLCCPLNCNLETRLKFIDLNATNSVYLSINETVGLNKRQTILIII